MGVLLVVKYSKIYVDGRLEYCKYWHFSAHLQCEKSEILLFVKRFIYRDEEGKDLLGKRTMDFKVSYLDAGLATSYFEGDAPSPSSGKSFQ